MLERARNFLSAKEPTLTEARHGLLIAYAAAFLLQAGLVLLLGGLFALVASPREGVSVLLGQGLQSLALALLPLALLSAVLSARRGGKGRALSAALLLGGLLAAPAWFALLLVMAGSAPVYPLRLGLLLVVYLPLGGLAAGSLATFALSPREPRRA